MKVYLQLYNFGEILIRFNYFMNFLYFLINRVFIILLVGIFIVSI